MSVTAASRAAGVATDPENREKDDFYPTPPYATEALLEREQFTGPIWEPACGDGAISKVLKAAGHHVQSTDLVDRGFGIPRIDFLMEFQAQAPNIITNPPFKLGTAFAWKALELATAKVAFLCRIQFLESIERRALFSAYPPKLVLVFSERLTLWRNGIATSESSGTNAFAWYIWDKAYEGPTQLGWI